MSKTPSHAEMNPKTPKNRETIVEDKTTKPTAGTAPGRGQFKMGAANLARLIGRVSILWLVMTAAACQDRPASVPAEETAKAVSDKTAAQVARATDALATVKKSLSVAAPAIDKAQAKAQEAAQASTLPEAHAAATEAAGAAQQAREAIGVASGAVPVVEKAGSAIVAHAAKADAKLEQQQSDDAKPWRRASYLFGAAAILCGLGWGVVAFAATASPLVALVARIVPPLLWEVLGASCAGAAVICATIARYQVAIERLAGISFLAGLAYLGLRLWGRKHGLSLPYPRIRKLRFTGWRSLVIFNPKRKG